MKKTDKKKLSNALATGVMGIDAKPKKVTTENIKKHKAYDHFKNHLKLNITQIKTLLNAPSLHEAFKLNKKMPKKVPNYAAWQVRMNWGYKDERVEKCFVCGKPILFHEDEAKGLSQHLSTQSVYFRTRGNWPSAVLDMEHDEIQMIVCDDCVKERKDRMFIIRERPKRVRKTYTRMSLEELHEEETRRMQGIAKRKKHPRSITDSAGDS